MYAWIIAKAYKNLKQILKKHHILPKVPYKVPKIPVKREFFKSLSNKTIVFYEFL